MGMYLDPANAVGAICAIGAALTFGVLAFAFSQGSAGRRYRRRLNSVRDRAQGVPSADAGPARGLSRRESATPGIDRIARRWMPRRDLLAARLARTGRTISIGQYGIATVGLTALAALGLAGVARIDVMPSLVVGLLIGTALPHLIVGRMGKRRIAAFIA